MQHVLGSDYKDPREYTGIRDKNSGGKYVSTKKTSQQGIPKNGFTIPYLMWAFDVKNILILLSLLAGYWRGKDSTQSIFIPMRRL